MSKHVNYRPDIDGLRAIAVSSVVIYHAFPSVLPGGFIGVDIFFVISGFLISSIIWKGLNNNNFSFTEFYSRRVRRIFPALFVVLLSTMAFGWVVLFADEYRQLGKHVAGGAGFIANLLYWGESGYFDANAETKPLLHLWSLGIEEQFYILWPLILYLFWKIKKNPLGVVIFIMAVSFGINIAYYRQYSAAAFYLPFTRFWELLFGVFLAYLSFHCTVFGKIKEKLTEIINLPDSWLSKKHNDACFNTFLSILGLVLIFLGLFQLNSKSPFPGFAALLPVLGSTCIITAGPHTFINRKILSFKPMVWLGLISYPLYLWHWPILSFMRIIESGQPSLPMRLIAVAASLILAGFTYCVIERYLRFGSFIKYKTRFLVTATVLTAIAGGYIYLENGLPQRATVTHLKNNVNELVRLPVRDQAVLKYLGVDKHPFTYCRFSDSGSEKTVAVIGDSHAHVIFPGIARKMRERGYNTLLLGFSAYPPLLGAEAGMQDKKKSGAVRVKKMLQMIKDKSDIKRVFIVTRGALYISGKGFGPDETNLSPATVLSAEEFSLAYRRTMEDLKSAGKEVFIIGENPELGISPKACVERPLRPAKKQDCSIDRSTVMERQAGYLAAMRDMHGEAFIDVMELFCPSESCLVFSGNGWLLYADDDHLSAAGSDFLTDELLVDYLPQ